MIEHIKHTIEAHSEDLKHLLDISSVVSAVGAFFKMLPDVAALLTVIWFALRIWESETVKEWRGKK